MQFGKICGFALIILGILLCGLQFAQYVIPVKSPTSPDQSITRAEQKSSSLPGIIGTASLVAGIALFATARRKDEPEPKHAVK